MSNKLNDGNFYNGDFMHTTAYYIYIYDNSFTYHIIEIRKILIFNGYAQNGTEI